MDIRVSNVFNAYSVQSSRGISSNPLRSERARFDTDRVSLSAQAEDYQVARRALANTPDVREDIVSRIREMLAAGTYHVPAQDVASSIFQGLG